MPDDFMAHESERLGKSRPKHGNSAQPMSTLIGCLRWLDRMHPTIGAAVGTLLIVGIGVLSYVTGPQLSGSFLYLIPILLVTRVAGFYPGFMAAFLAAMIWLAADTNAGLTFGHPVIPYWNALMRLGTFVVAVSLVSAMRSLNAQLEERVMERTSALKSQIAEKRELEKNILEISDREQVRIGQDLHDGLCQQLVSAEFSANLLQENLAKENPVRSMDAHRIADMIDDAITQARNLARGLYPVRLETEGLEMVLRELASTMSRRFDVVCTVECPVPIPPCESAAGIHLYRIAQEAVVNATKHANAHNILLSLASEDSHVKLTIEDDGLGMTRTPINPDGMGQRIMEYRARMIGADFKIENRHQGGTSVTCVMDEALFTAPTHEYQY